MGFLDFLNPNRGANLQGTLKTGGEGFNWSSLFQNKLFQQYLAAAGSDIGGGQFGAPAVNAVTQQNITTQNYMKMLQKMLGGEIPEGGSMTMNDTGLKIQVPVSKPAINPDPGSDDALAQLRDFFRSQQTSSKLENLNPFVSSQQGFSAADLAGLTPEMISQALQFKMGKEEMGRKSITDAMEMLYKRALTGESQARTAALTPSIDIPGIGKMTVGDYNDWYKTTTADERTADIKNFQFAQSSEGGGFKGDFNAFRDPQTTTDWKNYQLGGGAEKLGPFDPWLIKQKKAGATTIDLSPFERTTQTERAQRQASVMDAGFSAEVKKTLMENRRSWNSTAEAEGLSKSAGITVEKAVIAIQRAKVREAMDAQIRQAYVGQTVTRDSKGWYVDGKLVVRDPYAVE